MNFLALICGFIFIFNPLSSLTIITSKIGLLIVIYSMFDICEMIVFKKNVNKIIKFLKDRIMKID